MTTTTVSVKKINAMVQENRQLKTENQQLKAQSQRLRRENGQLQARIAGQAKQLNARSNDLSFGVGTDDNDGDDEFGGLLHGEQFKYPAYMSNAAVDLVNYLTAMVRIYHKALCLTARELGVNECPSVQGFTSELSADESLPNFLKKILSNFNRILWNEAVQRGYDEESVNQTLSTMMAGIAARISELEKGT